jgi:spore maturation protein CgeB
MVRQMMCGLGAAGAECLEYNTDQHPEALDCEGRSYDRGRYGPVWLRWEALGPVVEKFRPELIVCNAGGLSFRADAADQLRRSATLLGIALSDPDVFAPSTSRIANHFDVFLTNAPGCVADYRAMGVHADVLPLATNEQFFHPVAERPEFQCDVLAIGRAHADRIEPVRRLCARFDTHVYGEDWEQHGVAGRGTLFEEQLLAALNSARISVIFSRTPAGHSIAKVAVFDFMAGGALVATERIPELAEYLEYDREIIGFTGTGELIEKIEYYLAHPDRALAIREAGRKRVISNYTWKQVWPRIIQTLPRKIA